MSDINNKNKDSNVVSKRGPETVPFPKNCKEPCPYGQRKLTTKKSIQAKEMIQKYSKDFGGSLNDVDCIRMIGIARGSYYKYKREILLAEKQKSGNY